MNSSRTWKTGEHCRISGTYRCLNCRAAGVEFEAGKVIPMCDVGPDKDATWRLVRAAPARAAT